MTGRPRGRGGAGGVAAGVAGVGRRGLAAYLLAGARLRLLAMVPGAAGRLAAGATVLATEKS